MGYLDDLKKNKEDLHQSLLGLKRPEHELSSQKEQLKAQLNSQPAGVITLNRKNYKWIALAASILLLIALKLFTPAEKASVNLSDEEMILLNSLFVSDDQVDQFLDETLSDVLIE